MQGQLPSDLPTPGESRSIPEITKHSPGEIAMSTFPRDKFTRFLIHAKCRTYASQGDAGSVAPLLAGTRQLEYRAGPFFYRDIYIGMAYFVGQEIVYHRDRAVWSMSYAGGVDPTISNQAEIARIYTFLQKALRRASVDQPYRGPQLWRDGRYLYTNHSCGNLEDFRGHEVITHDQQKVYELHYGGGSLR
jgi:hypothetical protein